MGFIFSPPLIFENILKLMEKTAVARAVPKAKPTLVAILRKLFATPSFSLEAEDITELAFGAIKNPKPIPITRAITTSVHKGTVIVIKVAPKINDKVIPPIPIVAR